MADGPLSTGDGEGRDATRVLAELGRIVTGGHPSEDVLQRVAELAKRTLPGVEDVSLTLIEDGQPWSVVLSGRLAAELDERQYEDGFGPCLDAARTGRTIVVDSAAGYGSPYRAFAQVAARAGVRHTIAVAMPLADRYVGGLNVYVAADAPLAELVVQAEAFAGHAVAVVANVAIYAGALSTAAHLQGALDSRAVIEQAMGVIMARDRCSPDDAFDVLARIAQHQHVTIRDLARSIVDSVGR